MNQEMEFKNIVAQYSKVKPEEMTGEMRFRFWESLRIPLTLNLRKPK